MLQESDFDERSLSLCESTETSERMCGDFFNTVKKGPAKAVTTIEPPPEFQDYPNHQDKRNIDCPASETALKEKTLNLNVPVASGHTSPLYPRKLKPESLYDRRQCLNQRFASPRLLHLSPCRGTRPSSRTSLSSRLSSSHNSLVTQFQIDDSNFITQAISHDALSSKTSDITDMYNVPFDSDIYAVPIDVVQPSHSNIKNCKGKKSQNNKKRGKSTPQNIGSSHLPHEKNCRPKEVNRQRDVKIKRHSLPSSSSKRNMGDSDSETVNLTLREMRKYLHTVYSNSSSDSEGRSSRPSGAIANVHARHHCHVLENESPTNISSTASTAVFLTESKEPRTETNNNKKTNRNSFSLFRSKKYSKETDEDIENGNRPPRGSTKSRLSTVRILKQSFCNLFRWRRQPAAEADEAERLESPPPAVRRALPPLPLVSAAPHTPRRYEEFGTDFASSIEKVKDYGWYWGPISVEAAEKILSNEPDGSFIVRDSSDHHYIFTLTFKLNGLRHVRIEHHHGNFCFGGCTMFKASTIVEFIENAVETSRSGRYLFFLNQRPVLGPVRVQLLYPVSRFKRVQSLQHMCRFVILKHVRRDLIKRLPLPRRMLDYLNATHYYSELISDDV